MKFDTGSIKTILNLHQTCLFLRFLFEHCNWKYSSTKPMQPNNFHRNKINKYVKNSKPIRELNPLDKNVVIFDCEKITSTNYMYICNLWKSTMQKLFVLYFYIWSWLSLNFKNLPNLKLMYFLFTIKICFKNFTNP